MSIPLELPFAEPSYRLESDAVRLWVTQSGGHMGPVEHRLGQKTIQPYAVAPWWSERQQELPPILRVLRGDFFCMPFGGNQTVYGTEKHPIHGEPANADWHLVAIEEQALELEMTCKIRPGTIRKRIALDVGPITYVTHTLAGFQGPMCFGHHAMLSFPPAEGCGHVATSPIRFGQVFPGMFEDPIQGGYTCLKPGAIFQDLRQVPRADGDTADLSRYPAREGFEDLVMVSARDAGLGWTTVTFPSDGWLWFSLKDTAKLASTVLWHSNGGRHYAPWSGRHRRVLGLEEVTAYFHYGLAESVTDNPVSGQGIPTSVQLLPDEDFSVSVAMGICAIPDGFDRVQHVERTDSGLDIVAESGARASTPVAWKELAIEGI